MRIIVDKVDSGRRHSVSKQDIRAIFASVPTDWREGVKEVRLANGFRARLPVWLVGGEMTILSRGVAKQVVVEEILIQLAKNALGLRRGLGQLTNADRVKLTAMIQPYLRSVWQNIEDARTPKVHELKLNHA